MIVEEEQRGKERAGYGEELIAGLSERLSGELGKGFTERNLRNFRQFYLYFPIWHTLCAKSIKLSKEESCDLGGDMRPALTWSHYRLLLRVERPEARAYYMKEAAEQNWSVRALERQINSLYFERLRMSRDRAPVVDEMKLKTAPLIVQPADFVKNEIERGKAMIVQEQAARYGSWA